MKIFPIMRSLIILATVLISLTSVIAEPISAMKLKASSESFARALKLDSPQYSAIITDCLDTSINGRSSGSRLLDRFGIFLNDSAEAGMNLKESRFFYTGKTFAIFLLLTDMKDGQAYTFYSEFNYSARQKISSLKKIYFSLVFNERMSGFKELFGGIKHD